MEMLRNGWNGFVKFLTDNDAATLAESARKIDFGELLTNPLFWVVSIALLVLAVWRKQVKLMLLAVSVVAFFFLLQNTLPPAGQSLSLKGLLKFGGGTLAIVGMNFYFLLIRR
jgi:hypothetical protein